MNSGGLILIVGLILSATAAFVWLAWRLSKYAPSGDTKGGIPQALEDAAKEDVAHIFNDEFREELRNRGRLQFEKIIGENAAFLQQDLRQTTAQIDEYMRTEINHVLQDEFKKYEQSITDAKQLAINSMERTVATIEQQRQLMEEQLKAQSEAHKRQVLERFDKDMASIVNHYIVQAIGNQVNLSDQLDFILSELEQNKAAILEDINRGV
ncbi:MAG TPA: hypothetical protein VLE51_01180 [Candidatus Saccharimonadales bacterium]|nr:hypothetical protein [Candidatus Saccharimonadales bacterium]